MKWIFTLLTLFLSFSSLSQEKGAVFIESPPLQQEESDIVDFPDVEASFYGGLTAMKKYFSENLHYPTEVVEKNEQGRVYLEFIVEKDGSISNTRVKRGVSDAIDREAIRLIKNMPKWKPAEKDGEVVRSMCTIPINFVLTEKNKK